MCFLKGLNANYNAVKTQILMLDPLPPTSKVFGMVSQQERKNVGPNLGDSSPIVAANNNNTWYQNRNNSHGRGTPNSSAGRGCGRSSNNNKQCTFCGRAYHTVDTYYFKHCFPPRYHARTPTNTTNVATAEQTSPAVQNNGTPQQGPTIQLSTNDYQHLMKLVHGSKNDPTTSTNPFGKGKGIQIGDTPKHFASNLTYSGNNLLTQSIYWILDTGSTVHIGPYKYLFKDYTKISPLQINLPNGNKVLAHFSCTVMVTDNLILHNVLHIPKFAYCLISICTLTKSMSCQLIFSNSGCVI